MAKKRYSWKRSFTGELMYSHSEATVAVRLYAEEIRNFVTEIDDRACNTRVNWYNEPDRDVMILTVFSDSFDVIAAVDLFDPWDQYAEFAISHSYKNQTSAVVA